MCVEAFPEGINHSNTNVGGKRTALHDEVSKEPWGLVREEWLGKEIK